MSELNKILLADDEDLFVQNMSELLSNRGFQVFTAPDGAKALSVLDDNRDISAIILDMNMPVLNGIETLKKIKSRGDIVEVLILTGQAVLESGIEALKLGAYDYLTKPCDFDELVNKIKEIIEIVQIRMQPVLWAAGSIKGLIKPVYQILKTSDPLSRAFYLFKRAPRHMIQERLYIVDSEGILTGFIISRDIIRIMNRHDVEDEIIWADLHEHAEDIPQVRLEDVMHHEVVPAEPEESLVVIGQTMTAHNLQSMPVVDKGRLIGVIRLFDILEFIRRETE